MDMSRLLDQVMMSCRNFIVPMDLEFFMPPEKIPQALKALDVDGDGKISLADMRDAVIQVCIENKRMERKDYTFGGDFMSSLAIYQAAQREGGRMSL